VAEPQAGHRDEHADAVEHEEQQVLAAEAGAAAVAEGPVAVAEVGERRRDRDADHLGGQRLVVHRALAAGEPEQVEQADVDDEGHQADDAELGHLVPEPVHAVGEAAEQGLLDGRLDRRRTTGGRVAHLRMVPVHETPMRPADGRFPPTRIDLDRERVSAPTPALAFPP